jgi:hypothetical protein
MPHAPLHPRHPAAALVLLGAVATPPQPPARAAAAAAAAAESPLHVPTIAFQFAVDGGVVRPARHAVLVHNGGARPLTDVRVTRIALADSGRAGAWLTASPGRASVAPDELTTVGALCVRASGLPPGTYRAEADVVAREASATPVRLAVTLVVGAGGAGGDATGAAPGGGLRR